MRGHMIIRTLFITTATLAVLVLFLPGFSPVFAQPVIPVVDAMPAEPQKIILGWLENIRVMPSRTLMRAKLDSGARTSTIHAEDIEYSEYTGQTWVTFSILKDHDDPDSERVQMELPLQKHVNIKLRYTPERDERPVVMLNICLAGTIYEVPFSLTERSDFNYPVLLGREFIQEYFLIDPSKTYSQRTRCPRAE
jgi:hypothetical protein